MLHVSICSRLFAYPAQCPCCADPAPASELGIRLGPSDRTVAADTAHEVLFPYCRRCVEHVAIGDAASAAYAFAMWSGILGGLVTGLLFGARHGLFVLGAAIAVAILVASIIQSRARAGRRAACATAGRAVVYRGWSGSTSTFGFASAAYAAQFAALNAQDLVTSDTPLDELLAARPRLAHPFAAVNVTAWLDDVAQQPTRIARRMVLVRALEAVANPAARRAIADAVSRAELGPMFAQLDGLSRGARRQQLTRAIADARADNIPDELRDAKLRALTSRSFELG